MLVLSKISSSSRVNQLAHSRIGLNGCGPTRLSICEIQTNVLRIASLNVGTLKGRFNEMVETMSRRGIDLCCIQEYRWRGASARMIKSKDSRYSCFWISNKLSTGSASDRLMIMKTLLLLCYW